MPVTSDGREKRTIWSADDIRSLPDEPKELYALSERQTSALQTAISTMMWKTRWYGSITKREIESFHADTSDALMIPVDICAQVIACVIAELDAPGSALASKLDERIIERMSDRAPNTDENGICLPSGEVVADGGDECDFDILFGFITGIMRYTFEITRDVLETIEAQTSNVEAVGTILSSIPLLETLPFDEIVEWYDISLQNVKQQYESGYTQTYEDEMRCDLFQLACNECELTIDDIADYFVSKINLDVYNVALRSVLIRITQAKILTDREIVDIFHALFWSLVAGGARYFNIEASWVGRAIRSLYNDPDADWSTLCNPCSPLDWQFTFDFSFSSYDWNLDYEWSADWVSGVGIVSNGYKYVQNQPSRNAANINLVFPQTTITSVSLESELIVGTSNRVRMWINNRGTKLFESGHGVNTWVGNELASNFEIFADAQNGSTNGECRLYRLVVTGTGVNPFD